MTYETMLLYSQIISGTIFLAVLAGVAFYTFRPSNKKRFENASRVPLDIDHLNQHR